MKAKTVIILILALPLTSCGSLAKETPRPTLVLPTPLVQVSEHAEWIDFQMTVTCQDCADIGMPVNVWERAGLDRGRVLFSLPNGATVTVKNRMTPKDEGRTWAYIEYNGQRGWVPMAFLKR